MTITRHASELKTKSKTHVVTAIRDNLWNVTSGTSGVTYIVYKRDANYVCNCDWQKYHFSGECSHTLAVRKLENKTVEGVLTSAWSNIVDATKQHHTIIGSNDNLVFTTRKI